LNEGRIGVENVVHTRRRKASTGDHNLSDADAIIPDYRRIIETEKSITKKCS